MTTCVFGRPASGRVLPAKGAMAMHDDLGQPQQVRLLQLARRSLAGFLEQGRPPQIEPRAIDADLMQPAGTFVSLHFALPPKQLRGCIGTFSTETPLLHNVCTMAIAAGTRDPRFAPVTRDELERLSFEISVLSSPLPIDPDAVRIGVHGLCISQGARRGVLLPQVAVAAGWDAQTFLEQTCRKAGLPANAWQEPRALVEGFSAQVFAEGSH